MVSVVVLVVVIYCCVVVLFDNVLCFLFDGLMIFVVVVSECGFVEIWVVD